MKRFARTVGTLMIVVGVGMLAWGILVWRWEDPFTSLYTAWKQRELASELDRQIGEYRPTTPPGASLAAAQRSVAADAARYRRTVRPGQAIGRMRVPRLGLSIVIVNGTDTETLKRGPGRHTATFMPGQGELVYVAGHRTTYSAPFSHIDRLRPGDRVTLEVPYATFTYVITRHRIVPATATWALRSHHRELLALQACHPRFFASERYIAYARPIGITPRGGREYVLTSAAG
jgi:sortase A